MSINNFLKKIKNFFKKDNIKNKVKKEKEKFEATIEELKKETKSDNESIFYVSDNTSKKNIFKISYDTIKFWILKYIFRKNITELNYTKNYKNNIKIKITISLILSLLLLMLLFITMKITKLPKENYSDYTSIQKNYLSKQDENNETSVESDNTKNSVEVERISNIALEEEIEAQASYKNTSYSFNVNRTVKTLDKIHIFKSANWSDFESIITKNTTFTVNSIVSPGGYMMYQISEGEYSGYFITANSNLVEITEINDNIDLEFISKPIAIKILTNQNSYTDSSLKTIKAIVYKNVVLNIKGYGVINNRLVYYIVDGSFIPVDLAKTTETQRSQEKTSSTKSSTKNTKKNN